MASSGTFAFNPRFADHIDEAFERCGIDPADLKARHIRSATRSAGLMLSLWQTFGFKQHTLVFLSQPLTSVGQNSFVLPAGGIDIFHATLKRDGRESEMYPISRSDYNALHDKDLTGRPDRYFVDKSTYIQENPASTVNLWQAAENNTDTIEMWYIRKHEDAGTMQNTMDIGPGYQEAFAAGLAFNLSLKFAPDRSDRLKTEYLGRNYDERTHSMPAGALGRALSDDRDTGDAVLRVRYDRYRGRR